MPFMVVHFGNESSECLLHDAVKVSSEAFDILPKDTRGGKPEVFVLGHLATDAVNLAQRLRRETPTAQIVFLVPEEKLARFRSSLPFIPHLASAWTVGAGATAQALADIIVKAGQTSRRRETAATLRDRLNQQLSPAPRVDETERRRKQLALSESYLATLLTQAPDAIIAVDPAGTVVAWNDAAGGLFGVTAEAAVGRDVSEHLPEGTRTEVANLITVGREGKAVTGREVTFQSTNGQRWVEFSMAPVRDDEGRIITLSLTVHDVTDRRVAEARLRDSEALYRTLTETLPQLVWRCRPDGGCEYLSSQWVEFTGMAEAEQLGLEWLEKVIHPDDRQLTREHWLGAVEGRHDYDIDFRIRRWDGVYRWFKTRGTPIRSDEGAITQWFGTCTDIEEIVQARETLAHAAENLEHRVSEEVGMRMEAEAALRQAQKMEAVGQLTGGLAHDFNNLLTGIMGSLEVMQMRITQGRLGDLGRYLAAAQGAANRAAALTHRLLAFSRRQTLDPKPTDVNRLIAGMEDLIRRTVGPAIQLEVVGSVGLWKALVDPNQLENALLNLCINARDAMPDGGRLTIETANRWLDERAARQRDLPQGQYLSLCVTDTGTGMAPEVVERAFEPFFTTKPLGQGTGLGLSMIYGFARQSGGHVRIYSELGIGTTMCLYLPRHQGGENGGDEGEDDGNTTMACTGETVLVVDDEALVRMLAVESLEELGYAVIEAADGHEGLKVLQSSARVDLLITDVGLPGGMNGRQLADAARAIRPGLKVLFITGYAENAVLSGGHLELGMQVLTKPFTLDALTQRVTDFLA